MQRTLGFDQPLFAIVWPRLPFNRPRNDKNGGGFLVTKGPTRPRKTRRL